MWHSRLLCWIGRCGGNLKFEGDRAFPVWPFPPIRKHEVIVTICGETSWVTENDIAKSQGNLRVAWTVRYRHKDGVHQWNWQEDGEHRTDSINTYNYIFTYLIVCKIQFLQITVGFPVHYMHIILTRKYTPAFNLKWWETIYIIKFKNWPVRGLSEQRCLPPNLTTWG